MAYCKHCGMPIDEKKDKRCPRCGEFTDDRPQIAQSEKNSRIIIVVLLCVLVVLCLVCMLFVVFSNRNSQSPQPIISEDVLTTIIVQNNNQYNNQYNINDVDQNQWVANGSVNSNNSGNNYVAAPKTTAPKTYYTYTAGHKGLISSNTPNHDGVNMRKNNDANSSKVVTLPEGTWIIYDESKTLHGDEYIRCTATVNGKTYTGYVVTKYIVDMGQHVAGPKPDIYVTENQTQKQEPEVNVATGYYVSYNTPENKGLVMREKPAYKSDVLIVVPEGTELIINDGNSPDDEYWGVGVKINGVYYEGYILQKYIEYR